MQVTRRKYPSEGSRSKKTSTQMVFQRFKKQFLQHLRRRFWMPSNTSDPIRKMHTNKKRKATIKKTAKMAQNAHKKKCIGTLRPFPRRWHLRDPSPVRSFSGLPSDPPPEFNAVQTPFTGAFEVAKKTFVNVFRQYLRRRTKQRIHKTKPSRNSPMP